MTPCGVSLCKGHYTSDRFERRKESLRHEWDVSKTTAAPLHETVVGLFGEVANDLKEQVAPLAPPGEKFGFFVDKNQRNYRGPKAWPRMDRDASPRQEQMNRRIALLLRFNQALGTPNPFNYLSPPLTCVRWRVCSGSKRPQNLGSIRPPLRPAFG